ncbi:MAG: cytochrome c oxidase subunit II [Bdellovibrionales bacterium]|nr:cytochrome c oxidase subunit II [Bdellovibrionales bacterium]
MAWWISIANADYLPKAASTIAGDIDAVYNFILYTSIIFFFILMGGMIFFIVKYKRKTDSDKTAYITHNYALEFLWSFIPLVLLLGVFFWGWRVYHRARQMPVGAYEISVIGKQWQWDYIYPTAPGKEPRKLTADMVVPAKTPVILNMTSEDVIHSFYVPSFRVKQDVVPGKFSRLWFEANEPGEYQIFCTEFCGTAHSGMIGKVKVVPKSQFDHWLQQDLKAGLSLADMGKDLLTAKGCVACHSVDGSAKVGPTFKGIWERKRAFEGDGTAIATSIEYLSESILNPQAKIVAGYKNAGVMPSFQGQVTPEEINQISEYMKTLK